LTHGSIAKDGGMSATIFIVDDEKTTRRAIQKRLSRCEDYRVQAFDSGEAVLNAADHEQPDLVLLDLKMPTMSGLQVFRALKEKAPHAPVVLLTAYGTIEDAVEAMKLGAYDFLIKTVDLQALGAVVKHALELSQLRRQAQCAPANGAGHYAIDHLVARSASMKKLVAAMYELSHNSRTTVLLQGETGSGKEFIARVLHHNGCRLNSPFIGVNCTAVPRELFESELFGYEKGAFTGAVQRKPGLLEHAQGGTLFLDEIGDLDLPMQSKLLRVLQERSFRRLGGADDIRVDFQLIAATNRNLKHEVDQGRFREDLFYRLNVVRLELPPLRDRVEDIIPLSMRALVRYAKEFGKDIIDIDAESKALLLQYGFPGNIRELHNIIERAVIFCHGRLLTKDCLPSELRHLQPEVNVSLDSGQRREVRLDIPLDTAPLAKVEHAVIEEIMRSVNYNKTRAARKLGITRYALNRRLKKLRQNQRQDQHRLSA
jgi:two-component system response regulator AtoC